MKQEHEEEQADDLVHVQAEVPAASGAAPAPSAEMALLLQLVGGHTERFAPLIGALATAHGNAQRGPEDIGRLVEGILKAAQGTVGGGAPPSA